jgi:hypothetical protein
MALIQFVFVFVFVFTKYKITNVIQESKVRIKREALDNLASSTAHNITLRLIALGATMAFRMTTTLGFPKKSKQDLVQ